MIDRYTRPEMGAVWTSENKFNWMLQVEISVAEVQAQMGIIPKSAAAEIKKKAKFSVKRIHEIEKETRHDVIAFVTNVAENVGAYGKFVHYGLTSSDVLDTAFSLQVRSAGLVLMATIMRLEKSLEKLSKQHAETLCAGRTHGIFAEPTTFGFKMAGFLMELRRNKIRLKNSLEQMMICKLSGAVGTYSSQSPKMEQLVAKKLKLKPETVATQVIPRDRHADIIMTLSLVGAGFERLAVEFRHLQRSEVGEVCEGFAVGQKGSSAMPHKKNPISAENITGAARLLRGYAVSALENVALWHERDISHSSVERVIFPDAFIICDYAAHRLEVLVAGLDVNKKKMLENIELSQGQLFSSHVLLALVKKGLSRELAYRHVQRVSHGMLAGDHLKLCILKDREIGGYLSSRELNDIFSGTKHKKEVHKIVKKIVK
jgi:adenylosuccinate lyase